MRVRRYRSALLFAQVGLDLLSVVFAIQMVHAVAVALSASSASRPHPITLPVSIVAYLSSFYMAGLYDKSKSLMNIEEMRSLVKGFMLGTLLNISAFAILPHDRVTTVQLLISAAILFPSAYACKLVIYKMEQHLHVRGIASRRVLIFGTGPMCEKLLIKLKEHPKLGFLPLGIVVEDFVQDKVWLGLPVLGKASEIDSVLKRVDVEEIIAIQPPSMIFGDELKELAFLSLCQKMRIGVQWLPKMEQIAMQRLAVEDVAGYPLIQMRELRLNMWERFLKRVFDLTGAALCVSLFFWLFLLISALVKLTSRGPIIFSQERVGLDGKVFRIHKFRTMHTDASPYQKKPIHQDDPRVTSIGRILRRISLDELPQIFNVLKGDMSLVGPRPEMAFIVEKYTHMERERLNVKPGITGLWQISAARGKDIHENLEYDLYYMREWSLILDMAILVRTLVSTVEGVGAI